jgi:CheY-like chemotaxis protein
MSTRVLVVDDDDDFRELLRSALEGAGYQVVEASDGAAALVKIDEGLPDLALVDMDLPVLSGAAVVAELARRRGSDGRALPVVAMSGRAPSSESPARWFLAKPLDLKLLLGVVGDFTGKRPAGSLWTGR